MGSPDRATLTLAAMSRPPDGRRHPPAARLLVALAVAALAWAVLPGTASADPARPTNYTSQVEGTRPRVRGVSVRVVGGDSFLQVTARPGVAVEVPGYDREPYLRIRRDGVVEQNRRSPSVALNRSLTGTGSLPEYADPTAPPEWVPTGEVGAAAWHDHRIHWMLDQPPVPGRDGFVQRWSVPLVVDGRAVEARGVLRYRDDAWPAAGLALVAGALGLVAVLLLSRRGGPAPQVALVGAAALAVVLAAGAYLVNPPGSGATVLPVAVCGTALVLAALAPVLRRPWVVLAAVALLVGWALLRLPTLWKPVLPSTLPGWVDRGGTALVLGLALGVGIHAVRGVAPAPPPGRRGVAATP